MTRLFGAVLCAGVLVATAGARALCPGNAAKIYEAEDAILTGVVVEKSQAGFSGKF
jgi:hypothetical protein